MNDFSHYAPLRIPLNKLLYTNAIEIDNFEGLTPLEIESITEDYSMTEVAIIGKAIMLACEKNDVNFMELMPELIEYSYSHEQIHDYLLKIEPAFVILLEK